MGQYLSAARTTMTKILFLTIIVAIATLADLSFGRPNPDGGHGHGGGHGGGYGHGGGDIHGHGGGHGHAKGYSSTSVGHGKVISTDTHINAKNPTITTKIKLVSKPYPIKVPIKIPIVKHVPVTKTFKNVKTIKVPVHFTKTIPFEVIKEVKVPIKVSHKHSETITKHHHGGHGGYGHDDFGHGGGIHGGDIHGGGHGGFGGHGGHGGGYGDFH